jgi:hypothetical protein
MEETHNKKTNKEIMEMYPTGTYYICASALTKSKGISRKVNQVRDAKSIIGIRYDELIYAESGQGCLFYYGIWAPICDEHGNPLELTPSEPNYEIY